MAKRIAKVVVAAIVMVVIVITAVAMPRLCEVAFKSIFTDLAYKWLINICVGLISLLILFTAWRQGKRIPILLVIIIPFVLTVLCSCLWHEAELEAAFAASHLAVNVEYILLGVVISAFAQIFVERTERSGSRKEDSDSTESDETIQG